MYSIQFGSSVDDYPLHTIFRVDIEFGVNKKLMKRHFGMKDR